MVLAEFFFRLSFVKSLLMAYGNSSTELFCNKNRELTIADEYCNERYKYIWGVTKNHNCKLYRINGEDHIHIFSDLHPSLSLSDYIKNIKLASSSWMKESGKFSRFNGWQDGYGAFTYSIRKKEPSLITSKIKKNITRRRVRVFTTNVSACSLRTA